MARSKVAEFIKDSDQYCFECPCGNKHELSAYPLAQLASGNDMVYTCHWNNKVRKIQLSSKKFKEQTR